MNNKNKKLKKGSNLNSNNLVFKTKRKKPKRKFSDIVEEINILSVIIKSILIIIILIIFIIFIFKNKTNKNFKEKQTIKVALCTMGRIII